MSNTLRFSPSPGYEWSQEDMSVLVHYIQFIRNTGEDGPYKGYINPDFSNLSEAFKDQVERAYLNGDLMKPVEVCSSYDDIIPTWELPPDLPFSIWTNHGK